MYCRKYDSKCRVCNLPCNPVFSLAQWMDRNISYHRIDTALLICTSSSRIISAEFEAYHVIQYFHWTCGCVGIDHIIEWIQVATAFKYGGQSHSVCLFQ